MPFVYTLQKVFWSWQRKWGSEVQWFWFAKERIAKKGANLCLRLHSERTIEVLTWKFPGLFFLAPNAKTRVQETFCHGATSLDKKKDLTAKSNWTSDSRLRSRIWAIRDSQVWRWRVGKMVRPRTLSSHYICSMSKEFLAENCPISWGSRVNQRLNSFSKRKKPPVNLAPNTDVFPSALLMCSHQFF